MGKCLLWVGVACIGAMAQEHAITVNFQGMTPHIGQMLKIRLVETPSGSQRADTTLASIAVADFQINFTGESGKTYNLDYFVDVDGNKAYSAPPKDHAWRKAIPALHHQGVAISASHDSNFTDIKYPVGGSFIRRADSKGKTRRGPGMISLNLGNRVLDPGRDAYSILGRSTWNPASFPLFHPFPDNVPAQSSHSQKPMD